LRNRRSRNPQGGQAILLVVIAMSIFLFGALGLAIDGAQMYAQLQMAQVAADAGAQAGVMTLFDNTDPTNLSTTTSFPFTCSTTSTVSPCDYVHKNGFGTIASDTVTVDSPPTPMPGVAISSGTIPIRVTVQRTINTTLIRFLGPATSTIHASGVAAIVDVYSPVPILITHPTLAGSLSSNGSPTVTVCGGPGRSVQVNSNNIGSAPKGGALLMNSNTTIDLSRAGPLDPGNCTTGTGANFGVFGSPNAYPFNFVSGVGQYQQPSSPVPDPLATVNPPTSPGPTAATNPTSLLNGFSGCPAAAVSTKPCLLYIPGYYPNGIDVKNQTAVFTPGIYYIDSNQGFQNSANGDAYMATGIADNAITGQGMLIYDTNSGPPSAGHANTGGFSIGANGTANLAGSGCSAVTNVCDSTNTYKGILAFEDRNAVAHTGPNANKFGGGGAMSLIGTIYITPTNAAMLTDPATYQETLLQGNPGSSTVIQGEIITSALTLGGNAGIKMNLSPLPTYVVRQVALVK